jgi:hypothetical protein
MQIDDTEMNNRVLRCLGRTNLDDEARGAVGNSLGLHPLDLYRKSYCRIRQGQPELQMRKPVMPSAVELHEAGINFKVTKHETLPGIDFQNGVLSIPSYSVDYFSEKVLLNLMAYERLHAGTGDNITAYVIFMDNIIDTARDVALLREKGVIVNRLGSDEEIADLFNNRLSKGAAMSLSSSLNQVHKQVDAHCKKKWNKWRANLKHTYFKNPWASISFIAASILLVATLLQTSYSMLAYHLPPHS